MLAIINSKTNPKQPGYSGDADPLGKHFRICA